MLETLSRIGLNILWALGAILLFSIAVIVHEYGHFLAAKKLGFQVDAFSIGFGPAIWKRKKGGVTYRVGCIPFGGYVALPQLDPSSMEIIQGSNADGAPVVLPAMPAWKRILVAFAGPLGNFVLAVVLAFVVFAIPTSEKFGGVGVTVGHVEKGGAAEQAGLRVGDKFVKLNGNPVSFWTEVVVESHFAGDKEGGVPAVVERDGRQIELLLPVEKDKGSGYFQIPGVDPRLRCQVGQVSPGMPAEAAGLQPGDLIVAIDGVPLNGPADMINRIKDSKAKPIELEVVPFKKEKGQASSSSRKVVLTPEYNAEAKRLLIGIVFADNEASIPQWMMYRRPVLQLRNDANSIFRMLRALFAPKSKGEAKRAASDMGGAVTLFYIFWMQIQAGLLHSLAFLRFLCVNLGVLNLLPLPILDGGHILFGLIELVTRRKLSAKVVNALSNVFAFLLIGLMLLLVFRDVDRLHKIHRRHKAEAQEQSASAETNEAPGKAFSTLPEGEGGGAAPEEAAP